jgi:hypothetical protein
MTNTICKCKTKDGWCENPAVETLQIPIPPDRVRKADGSPVGLFESVYAQLPVCEKHRDEARRDLGIDEMN